MQEPYYTDTGGEMSVIVFDVQYEFRHWTAYFALCFWRQRLKFSRLWHCLQLIYLDKVQKHY